jgi:hypothetical protein
VFVLLTAAGSSAFSPRQVGTGGTSGACATADVGRRVAVIAKLQEQLRKCEGVVMEQGRRIDALERKVNYVQ